MKHPIDDASYDLTDLTDTELLRNYKPSPAYALSLAEAATIIDCKGGYVGVVKLSAPKPSGEQSVPVVSVLREHPAYPLALYRMFGGRLLEAHCKRRRRKAPIYLWVIDAGPDVKVTLSALAPRLVIRHDSANQVLHFIEELRRNGPGEGLRKWHKGSQVVNSEPVPTLQQWICFTETRELPECER